MVDAYQVLGLEQQAADTSSVLKLNYPDYKKPQRRHFYNWWQRQ